MRLSRINSAIIAMIAVGGALTVAAVAPNVLGAMGKLGLINSKQKEQSVRKSLSKLIDAEYVVLKAGKVRLTSKGERFAALLGEGRLAPKVPKHWDKKWRILIFDIPENRKLTRDRIRRTLVGLGFKHLQDSVWVYPYDCEDLITLLKADLRIGKDILYIIADTIEYDLPLRRHFGLALG